ncbi:hypothetical protein [Mucilaginibacter sp.]|jgi:hypothetical protein|uniref:hypothetical protein n=1 Tax=Mucilaginibacter sp. TaxID=1882438 RepID=UPI0035625289
MKSIFITLSFTFTCFFATAQFFEGKVVYHNTFKSKTPSLTNEQMTSMLGDVQNWYIKDGEYKSETNGTFALWQLYINNENKLYSKIASSEAILYNDAGANIDTISNVEIHKGAISILGYICDELVWTSKAGTAKYYFNSKLPINSKLFVNHKFGDWYAYLSKANAVPLKMILETPQMTMESIAIEVKSMKLNKAMFTLPMNAKTMKSPYQ